MKLAAITALATFTLDQGSKFGVLYGLNLIDRGTLGVFPPWLDFRMAWNQGINFGLFAQSSDIARWALVALSLAISLWVWMWVRRDPHSRAAQVSAGLLIGGALGNALDRVIHGAVADFLNLSAPGIENPYSFNLADVAIFAGAIGLVVFADRPAKDGEKRS